jgi:hypothetical protein
MNKVVGDGGCDKKTLGDFETYMSWQHDLKFLMLKH